MRVIVLLSISFLFAATGRNVVIEMLIFFFYNLFANLIVAVSSDLRANGKQLGML